MGLSFRGGPPAGLVGRLGAVSLEEVDPPSVGPGGCLVDAAHVASTCFFASRLARTTNHDEPRMQGL